MDNAQKEAIKEIGRLILLSVVSFFLSEGIGLVVKAVGMNWSPESQALFTGTLTYIFRGIDKYLHELQPEGKSGGLTRF